ncbi:MAG: ABC transporter ATP-binding protein, partial [Rhizobiales bacterium]|nr:ABC transporter ATP-binding protein [Hyphomicrobiales bacterium]
SGTRLLPSKRWSRRSRRQRWQTTYENIVFGPKLRGDLEGKALESEAIRLIEKVGLAEFKDKFPLQLSGGMQRRAELARALINEPRIMIMDEPFRGLDAMSRELMQEFFLKIFEENRRTQIFVTSEIDEAIFLADRLVILSNKPAEVRTIIDIELPRPRDFKMMSSPEAYRYKSEAMEILHEEAMKSFADTASASGFMEAYAKAGD